MDKVKVAERIKGLRNRSEITQQKLGPVNTNSHFVI